MRRRKTTSEKLVKEFVSSLMKDDSREVADSDNDGDNEESSVISFSSGSGAGVVMDDTHSTGRLNNNFDCLLCRVYCIMFTMLFL